MKNGIIQIPKLYFEYTDDIHAICSPLAKFHIAYFTYIRNYLDGNQIYLTNNKKWLTDYYKLGLYKTSLFECKPNLYNTGFYLWPQNSNLLVFKHGREVFNRGDGITLIKKSKDFTEFYFYSGLREHYWLNNYFINNLEMLEKFAINFNLKAENLIKKADKNLITISDHYNNIAINKELAAVFPPQEFAKAMLYDKKSPINQNPYSFSIKCGQQLVSLTRCEYDCLMHLTQGKTAKETAQLLCRSPRTIETHLGNLLAKTGARNKLDLLVKINKIQTDDLA